MTPASKLRVVNATRGTVIADRAAIARSSAERRTGLLKHSELPQGEGLWIAPCECIHTFGMKFPIDAVFLTKKKKVAKIAAALPRRRLAMALLADSVLELPAGTASRTETRIGDQLLFEEA
jgi:uncharacterized membrane protein (UPF0127 family)